MNELESRHSLGNIPSKSCERDCEQYSQQYCEPNSPPCITARRGGLRHQQNVAKPPKRDAAGVVFRPRLPFCSQSVLNRKTTPSSLQWRLRDILLMARPPILAVMQGGELPLAPTFIHSFTDRAH